MKKLLLSLFVFGLVSSTQAQRYFNEEFTQVQVTSDVDFATNIDFLTSDLTDPIQMFTDITEIQTALGTGQPIPTKFFDPTDTTTDLKVTTLKMDVYEPVGDSINDRPVVIYIHTGNFLPPPLNGTPNGLKTDSAGVELCRRWAQRGFVAVSVDYRLGWNPLASGPTGVVVRRATLLNAVYRALHDVKMAVRNLKADAAGSNTYGIDPSKIVLYGQGSGGYVALAYTTLDKHEEMEIPKFVYPGTVDSSYIDTNIVGNLNGYGGFLNLYTPNGFSADVAMTVNAGGALADTSWLEAGDAPMVSFHCPRDPFAPFDHGTVVVPTTQEDVVDVQGANVFMVKANALGNNSSFSGNTWTDPYTTTAKAKYGTTIGYIFPPPLDNITINNGIEGVYPLLRPLGASLFQNEGSPWEWWDPNSALATAVVNPGPPAITAHVASLQSNPDMSPAKGRTYIDTILGYMIPRVVAALSLPGIGLEEQLQAQNFKMYPNPASDILNLRADEVIDEVEIVDLSGKTVYRSNGTTEELRIPVASLEQGIYMIRVSVNGEYSVSKFTKL